VFVVASSGCECPAMRDKGFETQRIGAVLELSDEPVPLRAVGEWPGVAPQAEPGFAPPGIASDHPAEDQLSRAQQRLDVAVGQIRRLGGPRRERSWRSRIRFARSKVCSLGWNSMRSSCPPCRGMFPRGYTLTCPVASRGVPGPGHPRGGRPRIALSIERGGRTWLVRRGCCVSAKASTPLHVPASTQMLGRSANRTRAQCPVPVVQAGQSRFGLAVKGLASAPKWRW
jgi:hypothetical protein